MGDDELTGRVDVDALFTCTINLMWHLHAACIERGLTQLADDLLVALSELEIGPWRHLGGCTAGAGLPFTAECRMLDALLDRLQESSPGFGPRTAIEQAKSWLDPHHKT